MKVRVRVRVRDRGRVRVSLSTPPCSRPRSRSEAGGEAGGEAAWAKRRGSAEQCGTSRRAGRLCRRVGPRGCLLALAQLAPQRRQLELVLYSSKVSSKWK